MSDSLKDQLLKAGFKASPDNAKSSRKPRKNPSGKKNSKLRQQRDKPQQTVRDTGNEQKKQAKAKIIALIEQHAIKTFVGESVYRFMVRQRIRELHVSEAIRQQLIDGALVITRLNGKTYLVPAQTGREILSITPEWVVIMPANDQRSDEENDHPVPDDLIW